MAEEKFPEFRVCACGAHGRILQADGKADIEVYSQKLARIALAVAVEQGRVALRHCAALHGAIQRSGLPATNEAADAVVCRNVWAWNNGWERRSSGSPEPRCLKEVER